jgi:cytochrome c-type biogenesis protein CcmH/NrfG
VIALGVLLVAGLRAPPREVDGTARAATAGAAAAFLVFCVAAGVDWMWESTAVCALGLVLGTIAVADRAPSLARVRWPLRTGVAILSVGAILLQLPLFVAASAIRSSQQAVQEGRFVDALRDATDAAETETWGASGFLQRALVLEQVGRLGAAEVAAQRATQLEPVNWQLWLVLGRIRAERGRVAPALAAVARARSLNPRSPLFQPGMARALRQGAAELSDQGRSRSP